MNIEWIGVDLDGTLAYYDKFRGPAHIGVPIPLMVNRVKHWLEQGKRVKIFTARVWDNGTTRNKEEATKARIAINKWCLKNLGQVLEITNIKDYDMIELWDDRAFGVEKNKGWRR